MRARAQAKAEAKMPPGAFLNDGRYSATAELHHRGSVDGLTRRLVAMRREGRLTPEDAARLIEAASAQGAFPSHQHWATLAGRCAPGSAIWPLVPAHTSVEAAVKYEGRAESGHWCGERFFSGTEHDCPDPRHREPAVAMPDEFRRELFGLKAALSSGWEALPDDAVEFPEPSDASTVDDAAAVVDEDDPPPLEIA